MVRFERGVPRKDLVGQALLFGAWLVITVLLVWLRPSSTGHGTHVQLGLPPCPAMIVYGKPCPGCGLTTSWSSLAHGDCVQGFRSHAFGPPLYLFFSVFAVLGGWGFFKRVRIDTSSNRFMWFSIIFTVSFIGYGVIRFFVSDPSVPF